MCTARRSIIVVLSCPARRNEKKEIWLKTFCALVACLICDKIWWLVTSFYSQKMFLKKDSPFEKLMNIWIFFSTIEYTKSWIDIKAIHWSILWQLFWPIISFWCKKVQRCISFWNGKFRWTSVVTKIEYCNNHKI